MADLTRCACRWLSRRSRRSRRSRPGVCLPALLVSASLLLAVAVAAEPGADPVTDPGTVPGTVPATVLGTDPGAVSVSAPLVDINRADVAMLAASLPGIGPVKAAAIVAERERIGGFRRAEDLLAVPGIGPKTLAAIRDRLRIDATAMADLSRTTRPDEATRAVRAIVDAARQAEPRIR